MEESRAAKFLLPIAKALLKLPKDSLFVFTESAGESNDNRYELSYEIRLPKTTNEKKKAANYLLARKAFVEMGFVKSPDSELLDVIDDLPEFILNLPTIAYSSPDKGEKDRDTMDALNAIYGEFPSESLSPEELLSEIKSRTLTNNPWK